MASYSFKSYQREIRGFPAQDNDHKEKDKAVIPSAKHSWKPHRALLLAVACVVVGSVLISFSSSSVEENPSTLLGSIYNKNNLGLWGNSFKTQRDKEEEEGEKEGEKYRKKYANNNDSSNQDNDSDEDNDNHNNNNDDDFFAFDFVYNSHFEEDKHLTKHKRRNGIKSGRIVKKKDIGTDSITGSSTTSPWWKLSSYNPFSVLWGSSQKTAQDDGSDDEGLGGTGDDDDFFAFDFDYHSHFAEDKHLTKHKRRNENKHGRGYDYEYEGDDNFNDDNSGGGDKGRDKERDEGGNGNSGDEGGDEGDYDYEYDYDYDSDDDKYLVSPAGLRLEGYPSLEVQQQYMRDLKEIDWNAVEQDIEDLLTDSQDWWPADYGNYGGLFIRLSWHSCGSYRTSDGRGGCDGGGQRFDPERSWPDNTNLDKARRLLEPIKQKYGNGLSWGDLFALSGTVAIKSMGGPVLGFCAGRLDFKEAVQTQALGPTPEQEKFAKCEVNGQCPFPLGQNTLGLIYVNPEGPMGEPDLDGAADTVRDVFGRMDWHGRKLVALIGGGHTFGKAHGATTDSPGKTPAECPFAPWAGATGMKAVTSGFEGPWTEEPTKWDNKYFQYLVDYQWEPKMGPGGHFQWHVKHGVKGPKAPVADPNLTDQTQDIMMLTTDVALKADPEYFEFVQEFAENITAFEETFAEAWYQLVTRDVGPVERCVGPNVPPPQKFQHALPKPHKKLADMDQVAHDVKKLIKKDDNLEHELIRLAFQCASTYRATDYYGGCNGARIRFPPGSDWPINEGLDKTLEKLEPIKEKYGKGLSYADLIVLAGNIAAEHMGAPKMDFCPGRTDAEDGSGWKHLEYGLTEAPTTVDALIELCYRRGQTLRECVALTFAIFESSDNLADLLANKNSSSILAEGLIYYPELRHWADHYVAAGTDEYSSDFAASWTRLMNADRFKGPLGNVCD